MFLKQEKSIITNIFQKENICFLNKEKSIITNISKRKHLYRKKHFTFRTNDGMHSNIICKYVYICVNNANHSPISGTIQ